MSDDPMEFYMLAGVEVERLVNSAPDRETQFKVASAFLFHGVMALRQFLGQDAALEAVRVLLDTIDQDADQSGREPTRTGALQ